MLDARIHPSTYPTIHIQTYIPLQKPQLQPTRSTIPCCGCADAAKVFFLKKKKKKGVEREGEKKNINTVITKSRRQLLAQLFTVTFELRGSLEVIGFSTAASLQVHCHILSLLSFIIFTVVGKKASRLKTSCHFNFNHAQALRRAHDSLCFSLSQESVSSSLAAAVADGSLSEALQAACDCTAQALTVDTSPVGQVLHT